MSNTSLNFDIDISEFKEKKKNTHLLFFEVYLLNNTIIAQYISILICFTVNNTLQLKWAFRSFWFACGSKFSCERASCCCNATSRAVAQQCVYTVHVVKVDHLLVTKKNVSVQVSIRQIFPNLILQNEFTLCTLCIYL